MDTAAFKEKLKFGPTDVVALLILAAGGIRIFGDGEISGRLDNTTLLYLTAAAAVLLLKRTKTFKFGELGESIRGQPST